MNGRAADLEALGVLAEPQRARIYELLTAADAPRTRQQICDALGLGRTLVAFHLRKLEQAHLVEPVTEPAVTGRRGRPAQLYRAVQRELNVSVPPRRYALLAEILLEAARDQRPGEAFADAATRAARRSGEHLAAEQPATDGLWPLLDRLGYEPVAEGRRVLLTNCPFQRARVVNAELACAINVALADGYLAGLGAADRFTARLRPSPDACCVVVEPAA